MLSRLVGTSGREIDWLFVPCCGQRKSRWVLLLFGLRRRYGIELCAGWVLWMRANGEAWFWVLGKEGMTWQFCYGTYLDFVGGKMDMCRAFTACLRRLYPTAQIPTNPLTTLEFMFLRSSANLPPPPPVRALFNPNIQLPLPSLLFSSFAFRSNEATYLHWPSKALLYVVYTS